MLPVTPDHWRGLLVTAGLYRYLSMTPEDARYIHRPADYYLQVVDDTFSQPL